MKSLIDRIPQALRAKAKAALIRAAWTFGGALASALGVGAATELNYVIAADFALGAAIVSFIKSMVVGMPETTYATVEPFTARVTGEQMLRVLASDDELHLLTHNPEVTPASDAAPPGTSKPSSAAGKFKPRT